MVKQIQIIEPRKVAVVDMPDPEPLGKEDVLVETLYTGISAGTEMAFFQGTAPHLAKKYDNDLNLFVEGEANTKYPLSYGYENIGKVVTVGENVAGLKVGDIVASYSGHISKFKTAASNLMLLPPMEPQCGIFMALLGVAYSNILNAKILMTETVSVFGLGVVGQLLIQLSKLSGAGTVIAVDLLDKRLQTAKESGADIILNPRETKDIAREVRRLTANRGADVVFECSGSTVALNEAIRTVYPGGTVYATSFYRGEAKGLFLGDEFHHLKSRIVSSGSIPYDVRPRWDSKRWRETIIKTLPVLKLKHLISHEFSLADAPKAYDLVDRTPHDTMQVIFSYQ